MNARTLACVGSVCVLVAAAGRASAQCDYQQIVAGDAQTNAYNGGCVAMDGQYVLTGAPGRNAAGLSGSGEVYAFAPFGTSYGQVAHMIAPVPAAGDYFGCAVGMGGGAQWAVVGAKGASGSSGKAYIFKRDLQTNLWASTATLNPGGTGGYFGQAVAMNSQGTVAVVGAPNATVTDLFGTTFTAGSAEVYTRSGNTWTAQFDLHQYDASIRHSNDFYGDSVAADGNTVVTGCPGGGDAAHHGCGYIHIWTPAAAPQWSATGEVYAPDATNGAYFGQAVAISGSVIVVGAPNASYQGMVNAGAAYIFRYVNGAWAYDSTIHATNAAAGDEFGSEVAAYGDRVVIGSSTLVQKVHVFKRTPANQWVQDAWFTNPTAASDQFGSGVALSSTQMVVGAWSFDTPNFAQDGAAYIYDFQTDGSDTCAGATSIAQGSYTGCTYHCTVDGASTCGGNSNGPDLWFSYTAPASGQVTLDTQGSTFDTILSVHSGCPGTAADTIACNDDFAAPQRWSKATFWVAQGHTYLVRISGYNGAVGSYVLNVGAVSTCYANCDNSTDAPVLNINDFICFQQHFAAGDPWANCDQSTTAPVLNVNDFICFQGHFAAGCP